MPLWALIVWLIIGALAGFIANKIMNSGSGGLLGNLVLGIIGSLVGGYGLSLLGVSGNGGLIATFLVAVLGAIVLIWLGRLISSK